ncbi:MAG: spore coat protein CotJB [Bacillota bacterium]|jgi:spore coat protein JB
MSKSNRKKLLRKIQELEFAAVELNLYLDNNPSDEQALSDYNKFTQDLINLKDMYEAKYGPLTNFGNAPSQFPWKWVEEPWPWEEED